MASFFFSRPWSWWTRDPNTLSSNNSSPFVLLGVWMGLAWELNSTSFPFTLVCVSYSRRIWGLCHCIGIHFPTRIGICCAFSLEILLPVGLNLENSCYIYSYCNLQLRRSSRLWESTCSNRLAVPLTIKALTPVAMVVYVVWNVPQHSTTNYYCQRSCCRR